METFVQKASKMNLLSCGNPTTKFSFDSKTMFMFFFNVGSINKSQLTYFRFKFYNCH